MFNAWRGAGFQVLHRQEGHDISVQLRQTHFCSNIINYSFLILEIKHLPEYKNNEEYYEIMLNMARVSEAKQVIKVLTHSLEHRYR